MNRSKMIHPNDMLIGSVSCRMDHENIHTGQARLSETQKSQNFQSN